jgi:tetratricopeptide (TPR) repeat protein
MPANKQTAKELLSLYPSIPYFYYKPIVNSVLSGDSAFALELAQKAAALNPQLTQSQWHLALAYFYTNNPQSAKQAAEKAISQKFDYSNNINNLYFLAKLYSTLKEYEKSIALYQSAIERAPNELQLYAELVKTYQEAGQKEKAIELAQKLLASSTPQTAPTIQKLIDSLK